MRQFLKLPLLATLCVSLTYAFSPSVQYRKPMILSVKKAGSSTAGMGMGKDVAPKPTSAASSLNWCPTEISTKEIPTEENQVKILETNLPSIKNGQTNPMGAVAVAKHQDQTYCFDIQCPSCKIPLTKAKLSNDSITCDFCKTSYDIKTGERTESDEKPGFLGGIAKTIFSSQDGSPLRFYKLAERAGKVLISFD